MDNIEIIIAIIALLVASRALYLQKKEIEKNGKINSQIHLANKIQQEIDFRSKMIDDRKANSEPYKNYKAHIDKINIDLRPLRQDVDNELYDLIEKYEGISHVKRIKKTLSYE